MSTFTRIPALDGVRGLAALMVLFSHFLLDDVWSDRWWWTLGHVGWIGVDLFFVLSGFLITNILLDTKGRANYFREFYRRRVLRIFPLYYAVVLWTIVAVVLIDRTADRLWHGYDSVGWLLIFAPNIALALKSDWLWLTNLALPNHLWSLAVEEQYYMVWPLVVWLMPRRWLAPLCATLVLSSVFLRELTDWQFEKHWSIASYVLPYCRMDGLAAGGLLAVLLREGRLRITRQGHELARDFTFISGMLLFFWLIAMNSHWRGFFTTLFFSGFLYLAMCEKSMVKRVCETTFLRHIGALSYGLYVFHHLFFMVWRWYIREPLERTGWPLPVVQTVYSLLVFGATYALARLSWRFLEKPFLDLKDKKAQKQAQSGLKTTADG